jgi:arabinofuranosyltransferase
METSRAQARTTRLVGTIALVVWSAIALAVTALYGHFAADDFFITMRYAQNLARGSGFVFNPGERVFGVTEPAQVVVLALLDRLSPLSLPHLASLVTAVGLVGLAGLLGREALRDGRPFAELVAGTLICTQTFVWACRGAGVIPGLALLACAVTCRRSPWRAGALAGLAVWFRPELALGAALLALVVAREERALLARRVLQFAGGVALLGGSGALAAWLYFGRVTPITFGAKQSFAAWDPVARASGAHFWAGVVPMLQSSWGAAWPLVGVLGGIGGVALLLRNGTERTTSRVLVGVGFALAALYPLLGVPFFGWYVIPCLIAVLIGFAHLADRAVASAHAATRARGGSPRRALLASSLVGALALAPALPSLRGMAVALARPGTSGTFEGYRAAGEWIRVTASPGEDVTALEVGTLAYFSDRRVVDLLGLVSPESEKRVRDRSVIDGLREAPSEFFVLTPGLEGLTGPVRDQPWFGAAYELAQTFPGEGGQPVWVFRRRPVDSPPRGSDRSIGSEGAS